MKQPAPGTKTYKENQKRYEKYVNSITPTHSLPLNMIKAFLTGGLICAFGQLILQYRHDNRRRPRNRRQLVFFTSHPEQRHLNRIKSLFQNRQIRRRGSLVPITGFANSVAASAIEYRAEGQVFGIGCKIFTIAGPVILYGILSSWILGLIYFIVHLMEVM